MRRATLILLACAAAALAVMAAGCGGGKSSGGGGGDRLTKSEFIAKADGICGEANKKAPSPPADLRNGTFDPTAKKGTDDQYKEFGDYVGKVVDVFNDEVDKLEGLNPPVDIENKFDSAMETLREAIKELGEAGDAAKSGDRNEVKDKLAESDKHGTEADKLAKQIGLKVCGSSA